MIPTGPGISFPGSFNCIVIDTNVLLVLGVNAYLEGRSDSPARKLQALQKIRGGEDLPPKAYEMLWQTFLSARRRMTTCQVAGEVLRHRQRFLRSVRRPEEGVWPRIPNMLSQYRIEDVGYRWEDLYGRSDYAEILRRIGPTDSGLLLVAETQNAAILSDDDDLKDAATLRNTLCYSLADLATLGKRS